MSISIREGMMLYKAGRSLLRGLGNMVKSSKSQAINPLSKPSSTQFATLLSEKLPPTNTLIQKPSNTPNGPLFQLAGSPALQQHQASLAEFRAQLGNLFSLNPIDYGQEIILQLDETGKVIVANDHPDKARIESLLEDSPLLTGLFRRLSTNAGLTQATQHAIAFRRDFMTDPQAGLEHYNETINALNPQRFNLSLSENGISTFFSE